MKLGQIPFALSWVVIMFSTARIIAWITYGFIKEYHKVEHWTDLAVNSLMLNRSDVLNLQETFKGNFEELKYRTFYLFTCNNQLRKLWFCVSFENSNFQLCQSFLFDCLLRQAILVCYGKA